MSWSRLMAMEMALTTQLAFLVVLEVVREDGMVKVWMTEPASE